MGLRKVLLALSVGLNCILLYSLIWGEQGAFAYRSMKAQYEFLTEKIAAAERVNKDISKEILLLQHDAKYQEKMIRNRLNYVKRNEIMYIFPSEVGQEPLGVNGSETAN